MRVYNYANWSIWRLKFYAIFNYVIINYAILLPERFQLYERSKTLHPKWKEKKNE